MPPPLFDHRTHYRQKYTTKLPSSRVASSITSREALAERGGQLLLRQMNDKPTASAWVRAAARRIGQHRLRPCFFPPSTSQDLPAGQKCQAHSVHTAGLNSNRNKTRSGKTRWCVPTAGHSFNKPKDTGSKRES